MTIPERPAGDFLSPDQIFEFGSWRDRIEAAARAAHEANRAYCIALGDKSQVSWDDAPQWQRDSAINGVRGVMHANTPRESHESWLAEKKAAGWIYGETKDADKKTHPCMVEYDKLPPDQQAKDDVYVAVVKAMLIAQGIPIGEKLYAKR